ncbi:MAG TPA: TonB-dependent receptor [Polyangiaceae bacterium]
MPGKRTIARSALIASAVCCTAGTALAEEPALDVSDLSSLSLEELLAVPVVTGSGRAEERVLAAANVFIVTREEIERKGYRSLAQILSKVPGIYVVDDHVNPSVGVREVTSGYRGGTRIVKIMVDGFPVNFRPDLEAFIGPEFIPMEAIERVEVAKGPLSALYGANAFLATVNVITRRPTERHAEAAVRYRNVEGQPGGGASALMAYGDGQKGLMLSASMDHIDRSGLYTEKTYENQNTPDEIFREPTDHDVARPITAFGRADYKHDALGSATLSAGYQELDSSAEYQINSTLTHRSRVNLYNQWLTLAWNKDFGDKARARAYVGYSKGGVGDDYELFLTIYPPEGGYRTNTASSYRPQFGYRAVNGLIEFGYDFADWLKIDIGADAEAREEDVYYFTRKLYDVGGNAGDDDQDPLDEISLMDPDEPKQYDYLQVGPYIQLHSAPVPGVDDFRITAAVRGDVTTFGDVDYPLEPSYRAAVVYRMRQELTLKLIGGRAFQAPSGTLLFADGGFGVNQNPIGSERTPNPKPLVPQTVSSAELVAASQIGDFLTLEGSVYYQLLEDVIRFNRVASYIVAKNSGTEETAGGELMARVNLGHVRPYGSVSGSSRLSAEITRDLERVVDVEGLPSAYPRFFGYAGVDVDILPGLLFGNAELRWSGPRGASQAHFYLNDSETYELPGYAKLDLTLSTGPLPILSADAPSRFLISARNLFGPKVFEPGYGGVDIPQSGPTVFGQWRQEL